MRYTPDQCAAEAGHGRLSPGGLVGDTRVTDESMRSAPLDADQARWRVPVAGQRRGDRHRDFRHAATEGRCAS